MKHNKNKYISHNTPHHVKGFTLIEFLVASMLAMIVIVAASSTYMITRKLNATAQDRISVQQDIRNASVQIARDARMAGSFGCFNMGKNKVQGKEVDKVKIEAKDAAARGLVVLDGAQKDGLGVRLIAKTDLTGFTGLSNPSDGLLFIYGQSATGVQVPAGSMINEVQYNSGLKSTISSLTKVSIADEADTLRRTLQNNGDVVLTTCSAITKVGAVSGFNAAAGTVGVSGTEIHASEKHVGELSISKLYASLYVLGEINRSGQNQWANEKALLRYDLGADGKWQNPQLLATGIDDTGNTGMTFAFGYVDETGACQPTITSSSNSEKFSFVANPANNTLGTQLPALVQIRLKYYINKPTGNQGDAKTRDYIINTTVRAGNTCANRLIS